MEVFALGLVLWVVSRVFACIAGVLAGVAETNHMELDTADGRNASLKKVDLGRRSPGAHTATKARVVGTVSPSAASVVWSSVDDQAFYAAITDPRSPRR